MFAINLGGEGEEPGVINQQGPWALEPNWFCSVDGRTFKELVAAGLVFLICPNLPLPFPDGTFDCVYTNSVPLDRPTPYGPGVQSSEIKRILKSGGEWIRDGVSYYTKP
jgi:SAM-dependent methyltransferase